MPRVSNLHTPLAAWLVLACLLIGSICAPPAAQAYTRETHYYLRFGLALAACFDFDESHLIASGDWMMDGNLSTHAEPTPFQKKNKVGFHAFGHSDERFNELWTRTRAEPDLEASEGLARRSGVPQCVVLVPPQGSYAARIASHQVAVGGDRVEEQVG